MTDAVRLPSPFAASRAVLSPAPPGAAYAASHATRTAMREDRS